MKTLNQIEIVLKYFKTDIVDTIMVKVGLVIFIVVIIIFFVCYLGSNSEKMGMSGADNHPGVWDYGLCKKLCRAVDMACTPERGGIIGAECDGASKHDAKLLDIIQEHCRCI